MAWWNVYCQGALCEYVPMVVMGRKLADILKNRLVAGTISLSASLSAKIDICGVCMPWIPGSREVESRGDVDRRTSASTPKSNSAMGKKRDRKTSRSANAASASHSASWGGPTSSTACLVADVLPSDLWYVRGYSPSSGRAIASRTPNNSQTS